MLNNALQTKTIALASDGSKRYWCTKQGETYTLHLNNASSVAYSNNKGVVQNTGNAFVDLAPKAPVASVIWDATNKQFVCLSVETNGFVYVTNQNYEAVISDALYGEITWDTLPI